MHTSFSDFFLNLSRQHIVSFIVNSFANVFVHNRIIVQGFILVPNFFRNTFNVQILPHRMPLCKTFLFHDALSQNIWNLKLNTNAEYWWNKKKKDIKKRQQILEENSNLYVIAKWQCHWKKRKSRKSNSSTQNQHKKY